ncbi:MAG: hypothetical protein IJ558_13510 [Treponema sp.]|nr:hypothetical protein [Treponema sp.]
MNEARNSEGKEKTKCGAMSRIAFHRSTNAQQTKKILINEMVGQGEDDLWRSLAASAALG